MKVRIIDYKLCASSPEHEYVRFTVVNAEDPYDKSWSYVRFDKHIVDTWRQIRDTNTPLDKVPDELRYIDNMFVVEHQLDYPCNVIVDGPCHGIAMKCNKYGEPIEVTKLQTLCHKGFDRSINEYYWVDDPERIFSMMRQHLVSTKPEPPQQPQPTY